MKRMSWPRCILPVKMPFSWQSEVVGTVVPAQPYLTMHLWSIFRL